MFELERLHSQALVRFGHHKLAMSLLGGAGESRTFPLGVIHSVSSATYQHSLLACH